ncbi:MAG: hypothetical protein ACLSCO_06975 [Gallintestinimicrobium sp.]
METAEKDIYRARAIYLMILPVVVWFLLFQYWPMTWLSISFLITIYISGL